MRSLGGLLLLLVCVAALGLAASNPQMDDFEAFASKHLEAELEGEIRERTGDSALGRLLAGAGADLASQHLDRFTTRNDYLVASVYAVDLDGEKADKLEWKFVGLAGRFIPIETPEPGQRQR